MTKTTAGDILETIGQMSKEELLAAADLIKGKDKESSIMRTLLFVAARTKAA